MCCNPSFGGLSLCFFMTS
uniref:Uncharacterized protein n=1 Tax=Arundo donax TaxID=35708 RepID=A0A0A9B2A4_ARUDO